MTHKLLEPPVILKPLNLKIEKVNNSTNYMIGFNGGYSAEQLEAYSFAIELVLEEAGLSYIHKIGENKKSEMQYWEIHEDTSRKNLENLMVSIRIAVEEYDEEMEKFIAER